MKEMEKCKAIYSLHKEEMSVRDVAKRLHVSRNTVKAVLKQEGSIPAVQRKRFTMKRFLHEVVMHWGYIAKFCGNTNLTRRPGAAGENAVMTPEMERFAKQYGYQFRCHEVSHCNRKVEVERFWSLKTKIPPGCTFKSLEDLNRRVLAYLRSRRL